MNDYLNLIEMSQEDEVPCTDFESYIASTAASCGKVINHKNVNANIIYLFSDNNEPPNLNWIPGNSELTKDQTDAISDYWEMINDIEICGLPKRPQEPFSIIQPTQLKTKKKKKILYAVKSPSLHIEFFKFSDFKNGLTGSNPLSIPIDYFEKQILDGTQ